LLELDLVCYSWLTPLLPFDSFFPLPTSPASLPRLGSAPLPPTTNTALQRTPSSLQLPPPSSLKSSLWSPTPVEPLARVPLSPPSTSLAVLSPSSSSLASPSRNSPFSTPPTRPPRTSSTTARTKKAIQTTRTTQATRKTPALWTFPPSAPARFGVRASSATAAPLRSRMLHSFASSSLAALKRSINRHARREICRRRT